MHRKRKNYSYYSCIYHPSIVFRMHEGAKRPRYWYRGGKPCWCRCGVTSDQLQPITREEAFRIDRTAPTNPPTYAQS